MSYESAVKLYSLKVSSDRFLKLIQRLIKNSEIDRSLLNLFDSRGVNHSIIRRLQDDAVLCGMLIAKLMNDPDPSDMEQNERNTAQKPDKYVESFFKIFVGSCYIQAPEKRDENIDYHRSDQ